MNKDILLIILLIAIIISALFYLINNNNKENNALESFSQQNSLSTYYQQTVDENERDFKYVKHKFNGIDTVTNVNRKHWDGNWELNTTPSQLYFSFLQVNDQLVISISKKLYNLDGNSITLGDAKCFPDTFVGIASLNKSGKYFILNKIICDNLKTNFNEIDKKLFGYMNIMSPQETRDAARVAAEAASALLIAKSKEKIAMTEFTKALEALEIAYRSEFLARTTTTARQLDIQWSIYITAVTKAEQSIRETKEAEKLARTTADDVAVATTGIASLSIKNDTTNGIIYDGTPLLVIKKITTSNFNYDIASSYLSLSSFINPIPQYTNSYNHDLDVCNNSSFTKGSKTYNKKELTKCYISNEGLPDKVDDVGYSSYGTGCSEKTTKVNNKDICGNDTQTCFIAVPGRETVGNYTKCNTNFDITRTFNSNLNNGLYNTFDDTKGLCSYLSKFSKDKFNSAIFNSAIIMYVSDLTNVQTLNYEYFGQGKNKSNLTMQTDITTDFMGKILNKLRSYITKSSPVDSELNSALSLTNCFESNDSSGTYSSILNSCRESTKTRFNTSTLNDIIQSDTDTIKYLKPLIWKLNIDNENTSSCTFSLSSSNLYKKENQWVKYVEFNPSENKTNMSLYQGGTNQSIILENASIIIENATKTASNNGIDDSYVLVSGNLRTSNPKKYLIPSNVKSEFFNNSSSVNLQNNVNNTGKWVILGFKLTDEIDLVNTLNAIQKKMP